MKTYLLDVNLLLALSDAMHVHHDPAHHWFSQIGHESWATCPFTENGFVRIASHPRYPNRPGDVASVLSLLRRFCDQQGHHFWPAQTTIRELLPGDIVISHAHLTDIYLLGLAIHNQGKLATLDQRIPTAVLEQGNEALELIDV